MAHQGTLHLYTKNLVAFEHSPPPQSTPTTTPINTLLFIGGLTDGLLTVRYPTTLAASLPPSWRLSEVLLSSSYKGWATGNLARDARELGECVRYFVNLEGRRGGKVVVMGHSTGCQDCLEYLVGQGAGEREGVDGVILQAGVSDREAWRDMCEGDEGMSVKIEELVAKAKALIDCGEGRQIVEPGGNVLQDTFKTPVSAYRAWSLLAKNGDDDYFSSDLEDGVLERSFGRVPERVKMLFVWGGRDEYVPKEVRGEEVFSRWARFVKRAGASVDEQNSGIIPNATHNLNGDPEDVVQDLIGRVLRFLATIEEKDTSPAAPPPRGVRI